MLLQRIHVEKGAYYDSVTLISWRGIARHGGNRRGVFEHITGPT